MGSDENEKDRDDEDQHRVILSKGFWLAETSVTQALWQTVMDENPSHFQEGDFSNCPVESVSWNDAKGFIEKLNQLPDLTVRLPWEAEWEYACRAGTETPFNFQGELTLDKVNYRGTWDDDEKWGKEAKKATATVQSYQSNDWGLYEMHGNVWEWCEDIWLDNLGIEEVTDPWLIDGKRQTEPKVVASRVIRGGSWLSDGSFVRSAFRSRSGPADRDGSIGFRLSLGL